MGVCTVYGIVLLTLAVTWVSADQKVASHQTTVIDKRWGGNNDPEEQSNYHLPSAHSFLAGAFGKRDPAEKNLKKKWTGKKMVQKKWGLGDDSMGSSGYDDYSAYGVGIFGRNTEKCCPPRLGKKTIIKEDTDYLVKDLHTRTKND